MAKRTRQTVRRSGNRAPNKRRELLLDAVVTHYLTSHEFNGLPSRLQDTPRLRSDVEPLVKTGKLTIEFGEAGGRHPNPHIKSFDEESPEALLEKMHRLGLADACLYPDRHVLAERVDPATYAGRPYELALALGGGQLEVRYFDLAVLERYRSDPRFSYDCNDVGGHFSVGSEATEKGHVPEQDQVHIQDFGFAYDKQFDRAAAAFLRYLSRLSPEHQRHWQTHELPPDGWSPHPGWWASSMGDWPERMPLFESFVKELQVINQMCHAIGWPSLFLNDFTSTARPREFAFLLRPTLAAFNDFIHLLDKMMSENLSKEFFGAAGIQLEREAARDDGKIAVQPKGTVTLLEEWLTTSFRTSDEKPLRDAIAVFKEVRKLRQKPAHAIDENKFDRTYYQQQRDLMLRAYGAVRLLRLVLANHRAARTVEVPRWLYEGKIYPF